MRSIGVNKLRSFLSTDDSKTQKVTNPAVRKDPGIVVPNFRRLVELVARLSYRNPEHLLFFRGQGREWQSPGLGAALVPRIFRSLSGRKLKDKDRPVLEGQFERLAVAERLLIEQFRKEELLGLSRISRHRLLRWAIIQHYQIADTPLLDVTHSLRVAASFATMDSTSTSPTLYVIGVPSIGGGITVSAEHDLLVMRLAIICPPSARRPFFQEAYLIGDYPEISSLEDERLEHLDRRDFGRRLLAKFRLNKNHFWSDRYFDRIHKNALSPDDTDSFFAVAERIRNKLARP